MKKLIIYLILLIFLSSCGSAGTKTCIMKLQENNNTVYSIDAFNYIVIDDSVTYHYIAQSRWCEGDTYTRIIIK